MKKPIRVIEWNDEAQDEMLSQPGANAEPGAEPGEPESAIADKSVYRAISNSPKPPPNRVTLGYPAIAAARQVWVLASGAGKEAALCESLNPNGQTPLARVLRSRNTTRIFTDIRIN